MALLDTLRRRAYDDLVGSEEASAHVVDLQGWINGGFFECLDIVARHVAKKPGSVFVEVGSWKGASVSPIAPAMRRSGASAVLCVDTWLGSPEFYTFGLEQAERGLGLATVKGFPTVFHTFIKNVVALGLHDVVVPLPLPSIQAADVLSSHGIKARAVYVDASHEYHAVLADLRAYRSAVLEPDCLLWGDDYNWPGVKQAVDEFAASEGMRLEVHDTNWLLQV